jgi:hypothetical protein
VFVPVTEPPAVRRSSEKKNPHPPTVNIFHLVLPLLNQLPTYLTHFAMAKLMSSQIYL